MLLLVLTVVGLAAARPQYRTTLDEEELLHALQFRQEALDMEKEVEVAEVESRHVVEPAPLESRESPPYPFYPGDNSYNGGPYSYSGPGHYYQPAPLESRHIGAGLGLQLGPIGAGLSAGLGNGGLGFNTGAGFGQYLQFGTPAHYQQYWARPADVSPYTTVGPTQYGPWVPVSAPAQSRRLGTGVGFNLGPVGAGLSAGVGHGNVGLSGGFGFGGPYSNYGTRPHYQQYYSQPFRGPYFGPNQIVG